MSSYLPRQNLELQVLICNLIAKCFTVDKSSFSGFVMLMRKLDCFFFIPEARQIFDDLCVKHNVDCSAPRTTTRLLDKVCMSFSWTDLDQQAAFRELILQWWVIFSGHAQPSCPYLPDAVDGCTFCACILGKGPSFFQLYPSGVILNTKRKLCTVEHRYNKGPMDWQNLFAISRFCYIELHYNYWGSTISVLLLGYVIHPLSSVYSHYIVAVDSLFFEKIVFCDLLFLQRKLVSPSLRINMKNALLCFEHVATMRKPIHRVIGKITSLGMWHSL